MTRKHIVLLLCCAAVLPLSSELAAADGGGRGTAKSPYYSDLDKSTGKIKLGRIKCEMRMSNVARAIESVDVDWPTGLHGVDYAGVAFVDAARAQDRNTTDIRSMSFTILRARIPPARRCGSSSIG